jgi:Zn-dependent peptidase ImmA (M78 family)
LQRNRRPESNKIREAEASLFASSFLFPKSDAEASIRPEMTLSDFVDIKTGWGISIAAIVRRSMDLGIITPERYRSLQIQINQMHWRKTEPVQVEEEHPIYFKQMIGGALGTIKSPTLVEVAPTAIEQYLGVPFSMADKWADGLTAQEADWDQYPF